MSTFLNKYKFILVIVTLLGISSHLFAQCYTAKKNTLGQMGIETPETYFYIRNNGQYNGVSIRSIRVKNGTGQDFYAYIIYSGTLLNFVPVNFIFNFTDGYTMPGKLVFLKTKKTEDHKFNTRVYKIKLSGSDINALINNQLKSLNLISKSGVLVTIPVDDPAFMKTQINCLQSASF